MKRRKQLEEEERERLENEEFLRTGRWSKSATIKFTITQKDMERDLVLKTEGKMIEPEEPNLN